MMKRETWRQLIQIIVTILTAISSTVLVQSCGLLH
ncbi:MAG: smalltalk protein [Prevotella sp.]|nr:smalltalk protein [Prevotella sp.]